MKRNIVLLLFVFFCHYASFAVLVSVEEAKTVAVNFMSHRGIQGKVVAGAEAVSFNGQAVYYIINFGGGGWAIVSAENSVTPVLGYGMGGLFSVDEDTPEALIDMLDGYREDIFYMASIDSVSSEVAAKWTALQSPDFSKVYVAGTRLLNVPGRGEVKWGQSKNNDGGCTPAYNQECPSRSNDKCQCDRAPAGCGAVAIAQIMWYWQFPKTYDWSLMPAELTNTSTAEQGEAVSRLLKDCGDRCNMNYNCFGSWATVNNIESALHSFGYTSARKIVKDDLSDIAKRKWNDLIRAEIDAERPVFYRGDKKDVSGEKHFFVIDGYDPLDHNHFHINWGWRNSDHSRDTSFWYLNDLTPGDSNYNKNQMAIIGISPSCPYSDNISEVDYTVVEGQKHEIARGSIILPASGETLTVKENGSLTLQAEEKIVLNPGFSVEEGGHFETSLEPTGCSDDCDGLQLLSIEVITDADENAEIVIETRNANSFLLRIALSPALLSWHIAYEAGHIENDRRVLWSGPSSSLSAAGMPVATFVDLYNNCAQSSSYMFRLNVGDSKCMAELPDSMASLSERLPHLPEYVHNGGNNWVLKDEEIVIPVQEDEPVAISESYNDRVFTIYPNPNSGAFSIKTLPEYLPYDLLIRNSMGQAVYEQKSIQSELMHIDISAHRGFYILEIHSKQNKVFNTIIIQ